MAEVIIWRPLQRVKKRLKCRNRNSNEMKLNGIVCLDNFRIHNSLNSLNIIKREYMGNALHQCAYSMYLASNEVYSVEIYIKYGRKEYTNIFEYI